MSEFDRGDGRTHIKSALMRESLVDRRVIAMTHSERELEVPPDVMLVNALALLQGAADPERNETR